MDKRQQPAELLRRVVGIARAAGEAILEIYDGEYELYTKDDKSPLTSADLASHECIVTALAALTPDRPLLSEESADIGFEERRHWRSYWLIDPLDGTKEFIKRNGEFTVNIALIEGHRPTLGVVHVPVSGKTYFGSKGAGAFCQSGDLGPRRIRPRKLGGHPITVVGSRSHASPRVAGYLASLGEHELTSMGSSLKFCLVAEGSADLYPRLGPTSEWDTAAAHAVVEAAGGRVVCTDGSPLLYNTKPSLLNPEFLVFGDASRDWTRHVPGAPASHDPTK